MAKVGFRREIMGFNRKEVIEYIKDVQKDYNEREKGLIDSLEKLNVRNAELIDELNKIPQLESRLQISEATAEKLADEIAEFNKTKIETEKMSSDIAKMYLVSKSNAEAVKNAASESASRAFYEVNSTLEMLKSVHGNLQTVKDDVLKASQKYADDLNKVIGTFIEAKTEINEIANNVKSAEEKVQI